MCRLFVEEFTEEWKKEGMEWNPGYGQKLYNDYLKIIIDEIKPG